MSPTLAAVLLIGIFVLAGALIALGLGLSRRARRLEEAGGPAAATGADAASPSVAAPPRPPALRDRLGKTRATLSRSLGALTGRRAIDDEAWDHVEEALLGADVVRGQEGADPGSVVFDAMNAAGGRGAGVVLVDTAGRMHTKVNLMEELKKVRRIAERTTGALQEVLLVIDATTGQNGLTQATQFADAVYVTGLVPFDPEEFVAALFA